MGFPTHPSRGSSPEREHTRGSGHPVRAEYIQYVDKDTTLQIPAPSRVPRSTSFKIDIMSKVEGNFCLPWKQTVHFGKLPR